MNSTTMFCEICAMQNDDTREWLVLEATENAIVIQRWDPYIAQIPGTRCVCGMEHATSMMRLWQSSELAPAPDGKLAFSSGDLAEKQLNAIIAALQLTEGRSFLESFDA